MTIDMNEKNKTSLRYKRAIPYIPVALTIFVGVMLSVVTFAVALRWEEHAIGDDFEHYQKSHISALKRGIDSNLLIVESLGGLYRASHKVKRQEFRAFVKPFLLGYPGIQALEWIPRVQDSQRAVYEEGARQDGFPDFHITERQAQGSMVRAAQHEEYFPVYFVEPYEGNELALGFDLASNPARLEALNRSRETGEMVATARITLVQETGSQFGFLVFLPVYQRGSPTDSIDQRRENLEGFVLGVFRIGDMVERALTYLESEGIDIYLYDQSAPVAKRLLYFHSSRTQKRPAAASGDMEIDLRSGLYHAETLDVVGRKWSLLCVPTSEFIAASKTWQPWGVLSFGLLLTGLLAAYFLVNIGRTAELAKINEELQHEITERKQMEETVRESEEKYRELVNTSVDGVISIDPLMKAVLWNPGAEKIFGYTEKEMLGQSLLKIVPERYRKAKEKGFIEFRKTGSGPAIGKALELEGLRKDGTDVAIEISVSSRRVGTTYIATAMVRDITERKRVEEALRESEERYRTFIENVPIAVYRTIPGPKGRYLMGNPTFLKMMGLESEEELRKMAVADVYMNPKDRKVFSDKLSAKGSVAGVELPLKKKDGTLFWASITARAICDESGKATFFDCNIVDITARKQAEEEKKKLQAQILQSEKMASIGQLAAGVAHEINNPTGFVSSNLKTLSDYQNDIFSLIKEYKKLIADLKEAMATAEYPGSIPKQMEQIVALESKVDINYILDDIPNLIKESQEGTERIKKIVIDLKDFAHPGEQELKYADINKNLDSTLNIVWNELKYKTTVTKDYGELPEVRCYTQQLNQVFMNLLLNAAQAIEKKGEIRIATRAVDGQVEIAISDTGSGIPKENLSKIFDPFFTTKDVGKGTGMGLNIAYNIIEKHKGTIEVDSEVGKGATFIIRIPVETDA